MSNLLIRFNFFRSILNDYIDEVKGYNYYRNQNTIMKYSDEIKVISKIINGIEYKVLFKGYLSNRKQLTSDLQCSDIDDASIVLKSFIKWGNSTFERLQGAYSFIIYFDQTVYVVRDAFGQVPLYVSRKSEGEWVFADDIYAILKEGIRPIFGKEQLMDWMCIGPGLKPNGTIYKNIQLLEPGSYLKIEKHFYYQEKYYQIKAHDYPFDIEYTKGKIYSIFENYMNDNFDKDSIILLSGGLDSTIVNAMAAKCSKDFKTYSITYENAEEDFDTNNSYQPSLDNDYIKLCANYYNVDNELIRVKQSELAEFLDLAMINREMPGMADIDSSLLCLLNKINDKPRKIFTGECADEIFGGYPWFSRKELIQMNTFPWLNHLNYKIDLLNTKFINYDYYVHREKMYYDELSNISYLDNDDNDMKVKRKMMQLSIDYFMPTLINRMSAMSKNTNFTTYLPFANTELVDIAYNIPMDIYCFNNQVKGILKETFKEVLPPEIIERKKSPFPKTYSKDYESIVNKMLMDEIKHNDKLLYFFNENKLKELIDTDISLPFYGQLMCGVQLKAFIYQFARWLVVYNVSIE